MILIILGLALWFIPGLIAQGLTVPYVYQNGKLNEKGLNTEELHVARTSFILGPITLYLVLRYLKPWEDKLGFRLW